MIRRIVLLAATSCMAAATAWPLLHGATAAAYREGIAWFWGGWSIAFGWFFADALRRYLSDRSWAHARTMVVAFSLMLLGIDTVRIRLGYGVGILPPEASSWSVWTVRLIAGWATVWFVALFATGDDAE